MGIFGRITQDWTANFTDLIGFCGLDKLDKFCDKFYQSYCKQFSSANYLKSVEWKLRHYQASKRIALSALFYVQSQYLRDRQVNNISFYTMYYSLFNAFSANIMQLPYLSIRGVARISHSKVFSEVNNYFIRAGIYDDTFIRLLNNLRLVREAYSYNLPLGSRFGKDSESLDPNGLYDSITSRLPVVLQVSNLLSYLSHYAWSKKVGDIPDEYDKYQIECDELFFSFIEIRDHLGEYCLIDDDDYYRQGYLLRKAKTPTLIVNVKRKSTHCDG